MGLMPTAITSAVPQWLPERVLAGRAVEADPREKHLFDLRRLSRGLSVEQIAWSPDGTFLVVLGKRAGDASAAVFKLDLRQDFREPALEKVSIPEESPSGVTVTDAGAVVYAHALGLTTIPNGGKPHRFQLGALTPRSVSAGPAGALFVVARRPGAADGSHALVRAGSDGSGLLVLIADGVAPFAPSASRDSAYVACASASRPDGTVGLLLASTEGGKPRRLLEQESPRGASYHPLGDHLAFSSGRDRDDGEIYLWSLSDAALTRMTYSQASAPAFSPDGRSLAFASKRAGGGDQDVYVARFVESP